MNTKEIPVILAIDFDGTIADSNYPDLGVPHEGVVKCLQKLKKDGYFIIIWTCRHEYEKEIAQWLESYKIPFDLINKHHPEVIKLYGNDARKISADIYIDDKQLGGLPCWSEMYQLIKKHHYELQSKQK